MRPDSFKGPFDISLLSDHIDSPPKLMYPHSNGLLGMYMYSHFFNDFRQPCILKMVCRRAKRTIIWGLWTSNQCIQGSFDRKVSGHPEVMQYIFRFAIFDSIVFRKPLVVEWNKNKFGPRTQLFYPGLLELLGVQGQSVVIQLISTWLQYIVTSVTYLLS